MLTLSVHCDCHLWLPAKVRHRSSIALGSCAWVGNPLPRFWAVSQQSGIPVPQAAEETDCRWQRRGEAHGMAWGLGLGLGKVCLSKGGEDEQRHYPCRRTAWPKRAMRQTKLGSPCWSVLHLNNSLYRYLDPILNPMQNTLLLFTVSSCPSLRPRPLGYRTQALMASTNLHQQQQWPTERIQPPTPGRSPFPPCALATNQECITTSLLACIADELAAMTETQAWISSGCRV